jgi:signal transduction histidine kinase/ActR/RegA family two-component response regulator/HPt (histidine-containing phosphotransfer) domain-containing protein
VVDEKEEEEGEATLPWLRPLDDVGRQEGVMMRLRKKGFDRRAFMVKCSPVLGQNGVRRGVLVSFEDVTQLERTKEDLQESKEAAEEANAAKSEFLARMSHEIRTPMNAILGFTDVLLRGFAENESQRCEYLNTIHASGTHLLDLINDILDLSKVEAGSMEVELVRCSPYQLVYQVAAPLRVRAQEKGISVEFEAATGIPETVTTDPLRFRQVLTNLIGNAIKFTQSGSVKLVVRLDESSSEPQLIIDVIDTGTGMAQEALERIFDPFAQADASVARRFGGTGLGLSISRRLVEALGGSIRVKSELGKGSVFTLTLPTGPLKGVRRLAPDAWATHGEQGDVHQRRAVKLPPARILVADDGEANRQLITLVLRRAGVEVDAEVNGERAVQRALETDFDLILMDMQMPVMDGYDATATLRRRGYSKPIIALTADAMKGTEEKCRAAGCSGYLTKPVDIDHLIAVVARFLQGTGAATTPALGDGSESAEVADGNLDVPEMENSLPGDVARVNERCDIDAVADELQQLCEETDDDVRGRSSGNALADGEDTPANVSSTAELAPHHPPLQSSLRTDDPEFHAIVVAWVSRLNEQLAMMRAVAEEGDFAELARLAHWLKGSGATVGFMAFTAPAVELERLTKAAAADQITAVLDILFDLAERMVVPQAERPLLTSTN